MATTFQGSGFDNTLFAITRWLLPPFTTTATLLIIVRVFDLEFSDQYLLLAVAQFVLVFFVFKETFSPSMAHEPLLQLLFNRAIFPWLIVVAMLVFIGFATKQSAEYSRRVLLVWFFQAPLLVAMAQDVLNKAVVRRVQTRGGGRRAIVVGVNSLSERITEVVKTRPEYGIRIAGYFDDRRDDRVQEPEGGEIIGKLADVGDFVKNNQIDVIYLTLPVKQKGRIADLLESLRDTTASIYLVPDVFIVDLIQSRADSIGNVPIVALCETPFYGVNGLIKRTEDIILGTVFLAIALPFMILIGIAIKLTSRGPIIFKQRRYGLDGEQIVVYKFRSMTVTEDSDNDIKQATKDDARITPLGSFLRKSSLDEFPQLINVLQGRMSLVGPRPHAVAHNEMYRQLIKGYMVRHKVQPGITGLAQVEGWRGETEDISAMEKRIEYDLEYLRNWSLILDLQIIFRTLFKFWRQDQAY